MIDTQRFVNRLRAVLKRSIYKNITSVISKTPLNEKRTVPVNGAPVRFSPCEGYSSRAGFPLALLPQPVGETRGGRRRGRLALGVRHRGRGNGAVALLRLREAQGARGQVDVHRNGALVRVALALPEDLIVVDDDRVGAAGVQEDAVDLTDRPRADRAGAEFADRGGVGVADQVAPDRLVQPDLLDRVPVVVDGHGADRLLRRDGVDRDQAHGQGRQQRHDGEAGLGNEAVDGLLHGR